MTVVGSESCRAAFLLSQVCAVAAHSFCSRFHIALCSLNFRFFSRSEGDDCCTASGKQFLIPVRRIPVRQGSTFRSFWGRDRFIFPRA